MPLNALAETIGKATGKIFVIQPGVYVSITMKSDYRSQSGDEMYAEFKRALNGQGLATVPGDGHILTRAVKTPRLIRI